MTSSRTCCTKRTNHSVESRKLWAPVTVTFPLTERTHAAIALVNRRPHGSPGHMDIRCPQAAAWLAALRYAEKNVFM